MADGYERTMPLSATMPLFRVAEEGEKAPLEEDKDEPVRELAVADYLVFLLSVDTYMRYQQERFGAVNTNDPVLSSGLSLLRRSERGSLDIIAGEIRKSLTSAASLKLLDAALRPPPSADGASLRALKLRTILSRGGTTTAKAVFGTSIKARKEALDALDAAKVDDPDAALARLSAIVLKNKLLEKWIDKASEVAVPGTVILNPVQEATKGSADAVSASFEQQVAQASRPGRDVSNEAGDRQSVTLAKVEADAKAAAQKAMAKSGEEDRPVTKSEAIALATSVTVAVTTDPDQDKNVPAALKRLDPQQRAAAMSDGKVRVSAGAGSGKSTTLLARVQYLVDRGVVPNRMMAMSFNKKAADELAMKMASKIGSDRVSTSKSPKPNGVQVGTMHSTFLKFINAHGSPEQVNIFARVQPGNKGGMVGASTIFKSVKDIWAECFPNIDKDPPGSEDEDAPIRTIPEEELWKLPPKSGRMMAYMNKFQGEGMNLEQVKAWTENEGTTEAYQAYRFFEVYEGLKGGLGEAWRPNLCGDQRSIAGAKFVNSYRAGKPRVGDFNDMLSVYRDILRDKPAARKKIQSMFDHIMVDECQDLNPLQFEILQLMTQHIEPDAKDKSFWMVGDDKQAIYGFRGSDPNNFIALDSMGFKDLQITTNYRCAPEFVDAANALIAHNQNQIPMAARAAPDRKRGESHLIVQTPKDETESAVAFGKKILASLAEGKALSDFAVLCRTNAELGVFQQVCAVVGIPFVQKKAASVFGAQETEAFRAFATSVVSRDNGAIQDAFAQTLISGGHLRPKFSTDRAENQKMTAKAMKSFFREYCAANRIPLASFDPIDHAMRRPKFVESVLMALDGKSSGAAFHAAKRATPFLEAISMLRSDADQEGFHSKDLFAGILGLPVTELIPPPEGSREWVTKTSTFEEVTTARLAFKVSTDEAEEDPELTEEKSHLGTLEFVRMMMDPNEADPTYNAGDAKQFHAKFEGLATRAEDLRIDPDEHEKKQAAAGIPLAERTPPMGVYLGTAHSTKGAEWDDVTLMMPATKFPMIKSPRAAGKNEIQEQELVTPEDAMESERRLGYVALTRARHNLTVMCPGGLSQFVKEAGLKAGENVPQPETTTPGAVPATTTETTDDILTEEPIDWDEVGAELTETIEKTAKPAPVPAPAPSGVYSYDRS